MKNTETTHTWIDCSFSQESMTLIYRSIDVFENDESFTKDFESVHVGHLKMKQKIG